MEDKVAWVDVTAGRPHGRARAKEGRTERGYDRDGVCGNDEDNEDAVVAKNTLNSIEFSLEYFIFRKTY